MTEFERLDGEFIVIKSRLPLTHESLERIHGYIEARLSASLPIVLDEGLDLEVRRLQPTVLKSVHDARVKDLLDANNRYQERYRSAEAKLRELGVAP